MLSLSMLYRRVLVALLHLSAALMTSGSSCRLLKRGDLQLPGVCDILDKWLNNRNKMPKSMRKNEQLGIYSIRSQYLIDCVKDIEVQMDGKVVS